MIYPYLSKDLAEYYLSLKPEYRIYADLRGKNYTKAEAYRKAGFSCKSASSGAGMLESRNPKIKDLIECIQKHQDTKDFIEGGTDNDTSKIVQSLVTSGQSDRMLSIIERGDVDEIERIKFWQDIISGKLKTVRSTKFLDSEGKVIQRKVEEVEDVDLKIRARKELDKLLGLDRNSELGGIKCGDITVTIIDASKDGTKSVSPLDNKQLVEEEQPKVEVIDGEKVVVSKEVVKNGQ